MTNFSDYFDQEPKFLITRHSSLLQAQSVTYKPRALRSVERLVRVAYRQTSTCLEQNITENEKVRFFNIVKNKNAPFF